MSELNRTRGIDPERLFEQVLGSAAQLPLVRIEREAFLRAALGKHCSPEQLEVAIVRTPAEAGIPLDVIRKLADASIRWETTRVTGLSVLPGCPAAWLP